MSKSTTVALIGNPNTGKTSIFNALTGLNQKVGNYPGITVEKKEGICKLPNGEKAHILDLPGTYSLNTTSLDESVVVGVLLDKESQYHPDLAIVISDVENLKRNLLLYTQVKDLRIPTILVINMSDQMSRKGITIDIDVLSKKLDTKIILVSTRKGNGIEELKAAMLNPDQLSDLPTIDVSKIDPNYFEMLQKAFPKEDPYHLWLGVTQDAGYQTVFNKAQDSLKEFKETNSADFKRLQHRETVLRYQFINGALKETHKVDLNSAKGLRAKLDKILMHKVFGYLIFFGILLLIFQAIFEWSSYPSDFIDEQFAGLSDWIKTTLPAGILTDLISEGIISGIGGIAVFVPQIAFLFLFLSLLEESGYMSRVVFLMDRLLRPFGLSGKSVVPLMSGAACAIPAVMATRTIASWKERLITILVVPFTTCSARLPVYLILISLVIPEGSFLGFGYKPLTLFLLYILGFAMALFSAMALNKILKIKSRSFFMVEMPTYRMPLFKNVFYTVVEKTKSFVFGAGKIILAISIVLWFLGSNGFSNDFKNAESIVSERIQKQGLNDYSKNYIKKNLLGYVEAEGETVGNIPNPLNISSEQDSLRLLNNKLFQNAKAQEIASYKLEHSIIGYMGKAIEPMVKPLGYDWKIGIAVITSFAAREVFVGTLATIYSVGSDEEETIKNRMAAELGSDGKPLFNLASGISLMLFYAFAMQCMSTLAIVKRETNSWKWPLAQLLFMTVFAYLVAMAAYQILR
ncbi:ferrous iron transport protein B [Croceivirga thetidis]|uniref:Ferrous iron transport protein B n=1 Tax=Croceivirga thetidis TaxID=2721623 RepID=A0ABX1GQ45_9FLAO|nr:ferrous iron transport protein B [Croceivirga thetidis]NKI30912.1 ferrous iron transport protein B [Croceivirga thetidis]